MKREKPPVTAGGFGGDEAMEATGAHHLWQAGSIPVVSTMNGNTVTKPKLPKTLLEAVRYFSDIDVCVEYVARLRWPDGPVCPSCGGNEHSYLATRRVWKCRAKGCKRQFSVKVGTVFEQSPIGLDKWLPAVWLLANSKNGISSHELGRALGITQKSAWHVLHRVREALRTGTFDRMTGEVEVDETFIGGKVANKHKWQRAQFQKTRKSLTDGKTIIVGARETRGGNGAGHNRSRPGPRRSHRVRP